MVEIPQQILNNPELQTTIAAALPANYNFEIHKTLSRIVKTQAKHIGIQFPEGLLCYAISIAEILRYFTWSILSKNSGTDKSKDDNNGESGGSDLKSKEQIGQINVTILGDVTYGACCIDDLTCKSLGIDLLVHYGHSCLVPLTETVVPCLYVFVDVWFDPFHLVSCISMNFGTRGSISDFDSDHNKREIMDHPKDNTTSEEKYCNKHKDTDNETSSTVPLHISNDVCLDESMAIENEEPCGISDEDNVIETHRNNSCCRTNGINCADLSIGNSCGDHQIGPYLTNASPAAYTGTPTIALMSTVQFLTALFVAKAKLLSQNYRVIIPQQRPLAGGEVLGCTSPKLDNVTDNVDLCVFVADGRFHLESAMIHNPKIQFYRYDPFTKVLSSEGYDFATFHSLRRQAISQSRRASVVGLILGTLGRQGSVGLLERLEEMLKLRGIKYVIILMSELLPSKLNAMTWAGAFIQVACPRLSIDWGHELNIPLLNPYEAFVAFGNEPYKNVYPMDFYTTDGAVWTNYYKNNRTGSLKPPTSTSAILKARLAQRRQLNRLKL